MDVNFDIIDNHALAIAGRHIDLHNNFDFVGFNYNVLDRELRLHWRRSSGDWVSKEEFSSLVLIHSDIQYMNINVKDIGDSYEDDRCLSDLTFIPSTEGELNDVLMLQSKPNDGDDILYLFENGQQIRIHCSKIELSVKSPEDKSDDNFHITF